MPDTTKEKQMDELWDAFLRDRPQKDDFLRVIRTVPRFRRAAWKMMMESGRMDIPSPAELIILMQDVAELREEIWKILLERNLARDNILYVMENVPGYREKAEAILPPKREDALKRLQELSAE